MAYENIIYQVQEGIATITFNRPKALNALNAALLEEFSMAPRCGPMKLLWMTLPLMKTYGFWFLPVPVTNLLWPVPILPNWRNLLP